MAPAKRKATPVNSKAKRIRRVVSTDSQSNGSLEADSPMEEIVDETEAEVGIIEEIRLRNFMCHSRLDFKFGPNVNFIVGRNGSGKSAVLTGIVVGLGGRATATNRANTLKRFIKNGKNFAEVSITLRNCGSDAYKPEEYGNTITVTRKISQDGQSTYKLISEDGKLISNKREELIPILDQFNIQVDNPVSILNQEVSRSFLHGTSAHDKYKFFLKATQLQQMDRDYTSTDNDRREAKNIMEIKQAGLPQIEKEVNDWQKKFKYLESMDNYRARLEEVKNEAVWAQVAEFEAAREAQIAHHAKENKSRPRYLTKVEEAKVKLTEKKATYDKCKESLTRITDTLDQLNPQREEEKSHLDSEKQALRKIQIEFQTIKSEIRAFESDKQTMLNRIEDIRKTSLQQDIQQERQIRLQDVKKKTEKLEELKAQRATTDHHYNQLHNAVIKYEGDIELNIDRKNQIKTELDRKAKELRNLDGCKSNNLQKYGRWVPELTRKIEMAYKNRQFKRKPFGPLGAYVNIKEPKWALAVEICFGKLLSSFIADNHDDERLLEKLMKETIGRDRRPDITVTQYTNRLHDVSRTCVSSERHPSILEMLDVKEIAVANFLIDRSGIENILLIENNEEAREIMSRNPPNKCRMAYTVAGDKVFPSPAYRYYASRPNRRAQFLQGSVDELMRNIKDEISVLQEQLKESDNRIRNVRRELDENKEELKTASIRYKGLQKTIANLHAKILELNNVDDPEPVDVTTLEQEIKHMEAALIGHREKYDQLKADIDEKQQRVAENEGCMKELNDRIKKILTEKSDPLKEALNRAQQAIAYAEDENKHYEKLLKEHDKRVEQSEKKVEEIEKLVKENTQKALRVCPRVETARDPEEIDNEIEQIQNTLHSKERSTGSKEEITRRYYESKKKFETVKKSIDDFKSFIKTLTELLKDRRDNYAAFRQAIAWRVNFLFIMSLKQRNYNGKLEFDHNREILAIKAQPLQDVPEMNNDVRGLSGGERSFSTISLISAIWDAMEAPFRILDEYDVFMDMVTRRVSMDLLLETALSKTTCQYCFLTPLDITSFDKKKFDVSKIKAFKMPDPDRAETLAITQRSSWDDNEENVEMED